MSGIFEQLSGARAARVEAESAQNIAEFRAKVKEQEAKAIRQKGAFVSKRAAKEAAERRSALEARIAAAGGAVSPVGTELVVEQAIEDELEQLLIGFESEALARRAIDQATLERVAGKQAKLRGKNLARARNIQLAAQIATTPVGGAGKTLLTGF